MSLLLAAVVFAVVAVATGSYIIEPLPGSPADATPTLLILCSDSAADAAWADAYAPLAVAVQQAAYSTYNNEVALWAALVNVTATTTVSQLQQALADAVDDVRAMGFEGVSSDIHVAAHGQPTAELLAAAVLASAPSSSYGSMVLLSSYLSRVVAPGGVNEFPVPVLTVSGELDGITRMTRIAREYLSFEQRASQDGPDAAAQNVPVVIIDGANHIQFCCDNVAPSYYDLSAEAETGDVQTRLADAVAAFIIVHSCENALEIEVATDRLLQLATASGSTHLQPFNALWDRDFGARSIDYQFTIPNLSDADNARMSVTSTYQPTADLCLDSKASYQNNTGILAIQTHICTQWFINAGGDDDLIPVAPLESPVKGYGQPWVLQSHPADPTPLGPTKYNKDLSTESLNIALAAVSAAARTRYANGTAKQLAFLDDVEVPTGPDWFYTFLSFQPSPTNPSVYNVQSVYLIVPTDYFIQNIRGNRYGKLLPLSRAAEWILIDSLRPPGFVDPWEPLIPESSNINNINMK